MLGGVGNASNPHGDVLLAVGYSERPQRQAPRISHDDWRIRAVHMCSGVVGVFHLENLARDAKGNGSGVDHGNGGGNRASHHF